MRSNIDIHRSRLTTHQTWLLVVSTNRWFHQYILQVSALSKILAFLMQVTTSHGRPFYTASCISCEGLLLDQYHLKKILYLFPLCIDALWRGPAWFCQCHFLLGFIVQSIQRRGLVLDPFSKSKKYCTRPKAFYFLCYP